MSRTLLSILFSLSVLLSIGGGIRSEATQQADEKAIIESTLLKMENDWEQVSLTKDMSVLERILASDYVGTSPTGRVRNKQEQIAEAKRDPDEYTSAVNSNMKVHIYGSNIAVVTGAYTESGRTKNGRPFTRYARWTDTYVRRDGVWQCVASHVTSLPKL